MLAQRLRRWPNIEAALGECLVFAGLSVISITAYYTVINGHFDRVAFTKSALTDKQV